MVTNYLSSNNQTSLKVHNNLKQVPLLHLLKIMEIRENVQVLSVQTPLIYKVRVSSTNLIQLRSNHSKPQISLMAFKETSILLIWSVYQRLVPSIESYYGSI